MSEEQKSLLVIGAHNDDAQCGSCSGLARKLANKGWRVVFLNTHAPSSVPGGDGIADMAAAMLGAEAINLPHPGLEEISANRDAVLEIAHFIHDVNPDLVCIPWVKDNHYDHTSCAKAALKAISYMNSGAKEYVKPRVTDILAYEISSWQTRQFQPDFFVNITEEYDVCEAAIRAFTCFSQACLDFYANEKKHRCASWGVQAGYKYAEALKYIGPLFPLKSPLAEILGADLRPAGYLQYPVNGYLYD